MSARAVPHTSAASGGVPVAPSAPAAPWVAAAVALTVALVAHLATSFGLVALAPTLVAPLLVGAVAGVSARGDWRFAGAGTLAGVALGLAAAQPWFLHPQAGGSAFALGALQYAAIAVVVASALAWLVASGLLGGRGELVVALVIVAAIIGVLCVTATTVDSGALDPSSASLDQMLSTRPALGDTPNDATYYLSFFYDVHDGQDYYAAVGKVWTADKLGDHNLPIGVTSYRLPTVFWLWRLLPDDGAALVPAFLWFAALAIVAAWAIAWQLSRPGLAVLAALLVACAYLVPATTPWVTFVDPWAMAFSLAGTALFIAAVRRDSRALLWGAVAAMLAAALLRELLVYPVLLAAASVLALPAGKRARALLPWLAALGVFVAAYCAHVFAVAGRVSHAAGYAKWLNGGVAHLWSTLQYFAVYVGGGVWLLPLLVAAGIAGAALLWSRDRRLSAFLVAQTLLPLLAFLVFGNAGREMSTGEASGYWAVLVVPFALALVPVAIGLAGARLARDGATS